MAKSEPVNDAFKYLRTYSNGPLYAPVTGFFSINQTADRGLEASRSMLLNGEADSLIWQRAKAMLTGATNQGASIETSIDPSCSRLPTISSVRAMVRRWPSKSAPVVSSPW